MLVYKKDYVIYIGGRISSTNSEEFKKAYLECYDVCVRSVDAEKLEYISSAGLWVLLSLFKQEKLPKIDNVTEDVYNVFEMTGFTSLMNITRKFLEVSVDGLDVIGHGFTAEVYRWNEDTALKLFHKSVPIDVIRDEITITRNAFLKGIDTMLSFQLVRSGDRYGILYELLNGQSLSQKMIENRDKLNEYAVRFGQFVRNFHENNVDTAVFPSVRECLLGWLKDPDQLGIPESTVQIMRDIIWNIPEGTHPVHCDCHTGNVIVQDGKLIFIDVGNMARGNPIFDATIMFLMFRFKSYHHLSPETFADNGFTDEESARIWDCYIRGMTGIEDEGMLKALERQVDVVLCIWQLCRRVLCKTIFPLDFYEMAEQTILKYYEDGSDPFIL